MPLKLYGVDATMIIFVFVLFCNHFHNNDSENKIKKNNNNKWVITKEIKITMIILIVWIIIWNNSNKILTVQVGKTIDALK